MNIILQLLMSIRPAQVSTDDVLALVDGDLIVIDGQIVTISQ